MTGTALRYLPPLLSAFAFAAFSRLLDPVSLGDGVSLVLPWASDFAISAAFRVDGLSLAFALLITGVGALVMLYAAAYFAGDPRLGRLMALLLAFEAAMLGLVTADDAITLFAFWEGTTVVSYLLVGFDHRKPEARAKALQALLVTGAGGLALLAGLMVMGDAAGTYRLSEMAAEGTLTAHPAYPVFLGLILLGCFTKSAQIPFHFWLPNAMAAPTPVSAYLHSATMVKAGVYLLARLSPELGGTGLWIWTLTITGGLTMLIGAVWALRQTDLKLMLAHTTVSALGAMVMFLGSAEPVAIVAVCTFILVHAFYKAALFLTVGVLDKQAGTREAGALGGLGAGMPITWTIALLAGFSMAGFPPLLGFIGKELKYEGALAVASEPAFVAGVAVISNALMVAVGVLIGFGPFTGAHRAPRIGPRDPSPALWLAPGLLALGGLAFGLAPGLIESALVQPMARAVAGGPIRVELKLWHGINVPLLLSVATFALGLLAFALLRPLREALARAEGAVPRWEVWYDWALAALKGGSVALTRRVQSGRLRTYLTLTLGALALTLLGAAALGRGAPWPAPSGVPLLHWGVLALIVAGAAAMPFATSRIHAVAALGVVGAGVAVVFALYGAVDVAMTQLMVETLAVVIIAVALLRLPRLSPRPEGGRALALVVSAALGLGVTLAVLAVLATPFDPRMTRWFEAASWPEGFGRNVVNVILVDFRALDTFGEIAVVAVAAVAALALLGRRRAA